MTFIVADPVIPQLNWLLKLTCLSTWESKSSVSFDEVNHTQTAAFLQFDFPRAITIVCVCARTHAGSYSRGNPRKHEWVMWAEREWAAELVIALLMWPAVSNPLRPLKARTNSTLESHSIHLFNHVCPSLAESNFEGIKSEGFGPLARCGPVDRESETRRQGVVSRQGTAHHIL